MKKNDTYEKFLQTLTEAQRDMLDTAYRKILIIKILSRNMWKQSIRFMGKMLHRR